jgi:hypothetical protein
MTAKEYQDLLVRARRMPSDKKLRLLSDLAASMRRPAFRRRPRSITELRGRGKRIWKGVEPQKYVERERAEWNG